MGFSVAHFAVLGNAKASNRRMGGSAIPTLSFYRHVNIINNHLVKGIGWNININAMKSEMMLPDCPMVSRTSFSDEMLWTRLMVKMEEEQPWKKPDLTICSLARSIGSNRTRLSQLIHKHGYSSFQAFICEFRINAFLELLPVNQTLNVQGLFYEVGFKSKVTALRYFRQRTGMTPTEYFKNVILKPNR